jgi:hypothetical protein
MPDLTVTPRNARRDIEQPTAPSPAELEARLTPLKIDARDGFSCRGRAYKRLRQQLLALTHTNPMLSLELWGDAHAYAPLQRVVFYVRSTLAVYVTLYWLGPQDHVVVPVLNVRIPAHRDVAIDSGGYIVPPLGREQWVAVATLEPLPGICGSEADMVHALGRAIDRPHAVGRWEVTSSGGLGPKPKRSGD